MPHSSITQHEYLNVKITFPSSSLNYEYEASGEAAAAAVDDENVMEMMMLSHTFNELRRRVFGSIMYAVR